MVRVLDASWIARRMNGLGKDVYEGDGMGLIE